MTKEEIIKYLEEQIRMQLLIKSSRTTYQFYQECPYSAGILDSIQILYLKVTGKEFEDKDDVE